MIDFDFCLCFILTTVLLMIDSKVDLSLLVNRLLCTFTDLTELGAYIVQGILNIPKVNVYMSTVSKLHCVKLLGAAKLRIGFLFPFYITLMQIMVIEITHIFYKVCQYGIHAAYFK